jgi:hypothetical protein
METARAIGAAHGVVLPVRVDPAGVTGPTARQAATPAWRRTTRGLYVPAEVEVTAAQRVAEVGSVMPLRAAVTGWGSLAWRGARWFQGTSAGGDLVPVPVAAPRQLVREQPAFRLCRERWDPREVEVVDGLEVTSAVRSVCFAIRYAPHQDAAVRTLEMAYFDDLVTVDEVREWAMMHPSYTGIEQCRRAPDLADENAWSPMETEMRIDWGLVAGRRPLTNRPVFDLDGRHVGTPDLIDPFARVVGQYDGEVHGGAARNADDVDRDAAFLAVGLRTVVMTAADLRDRDGYHGRLRAAYRESALAGEINRAFTLELPPWWKPTFTVAQRRALSTEQREIWLRRGAPRAG